MAAHGMFLDAIICHIRNRKGDNAVIALEGLRKSKFHKRNREPIEKMVISQLPHIGRVQPHDWHEKLWEIYNSKKKFHSKI
jgi:ribosomal protein L22